MLNMAVEQILNNEVILRDKLGSKTIVPADTTILAVGRTSCRELYDQLRGKVASVRAIGDCASARKIMDAMHEGFGAAIFI